MPLAVFITHLILTLGFDIYGNFSRFDILMHFIGGLSIGYSYILFYKFLQQENIIISKDLILNIFFIISIVALTAVLWEMAEFVSDYFYHTRVQVSLDDTMLDMFLGILGGSLVSFLFKFIKVK